MSSISGKWQYYEEFDYGNVIGEIQLTQNGDKIQGVANLRESEEGKHLDVILNVIGSVKKVNMEMKATSCQINSSIIDTTYNLDSWQGKLNSAGVIVGHTMDEDGVCGVFTMRRMNA